ncbi:sugar transferase [Vampirovibrio sp.]|uniref:sugar transferase n=1 Tax=Vampirovibrio sp. TaxID=2717857 RepID=UPI003594202F
MSISTELLTRSQSSVIPIDQPTHSYKLESHAAQSIQLQLQIKRVADFLLSLIGLVLISPMLLVLAILVRLSSPGPVIYKSVRIGKDYQPIYMYKFRTMVQNADRLWDDLKKDQTAQTELLKLKNDNRITPLGKFLRKYSLDEFPQLFNVLKGEMSLVGPRPFVPAESNIFKYPYTSRFSVMPGMTGPWQVSGRSDLSFDQLCNIELKYVMQWSLLTDVLILLKTLPCVLLKKGAY